MLKRCGTLILAAALVAGANAGCSIRAEQLRAQPLTYSRSIQSDKQTESRFLIKPFEDLRGGEHSYIYATSFIPVVNFFHIGAYNRFPEQANLLQANRGGRPTVTVGALDSAMPFLLAELMRKMRLTSYATPLEEVNTKVDLRAFDYVVTGSLKTTRFAAHTNLIPLTLIGILGVPYLFTNYELEYDVTVAPAQEPSRHIMTKTYKFADSTAVGLYYNHSAAFDMFIGALEQTLPTVVEDVAAAVAANPPAVEAPAPPPPPAPTVSRPANAKGKK